MANIAFACTILDRFVDVTSAYSNTHLYNRKHLPDVQINEESYELKIWYHVLDELSEVRKHGTSLAYEAENFPWAYAYAKYLTEWLLRYQFSEHASQEKLFIVRPGIIGPSLCLPFPGYITPMSSPYMMLAAALALVVSWRITIPQKWITQINTLLETKYLLMWPPIVSFVILLWGHRAAFMLLAESDRG
ncbi:hypothetical protein N7476_007437 [Penicillium atrosanguineum]|uniref:Thioester reductase (TE) domain-containing protein n=1 Tax=Penicillium atrosanguineum TaxID=1132637 RepID=A0A9W9PXA6_9EURO|nr:hypothetical protein N7526_006986 [Penicillium atrosanguineum]KAJ5311577.1 hypothetical protein N7476_007437 [Penicillium atrosanguineum]